MLLPALAAPETVDPAAPVALVDVEQLHGPGLDRPALLPAGSPGYAHVSIAEGIWEPKADRFAGALLVAEMLAWCDERVREAASGESYFEPEEAQQESERFRILAAALEDRWGQRVAGLLQQAWRSEVLSDCPTFGEWLVALPEPRSRPVPAVGPRSPGSEAVAALLLRARQREGAGDPAGALGVYQQILEASPAGSSLRSEVELIAGQIRESLARQADLVRREGEAGAHEAAGRWQEAVIQYEGLLAEAGSPQQRAAWEEGLRRSREEAGLADLFDTAARLTERKRWGAAGELLAELMRQRPGYERQGRKASGLLSQVKAASRSRRGWLPLAPAAVVLLGLLAVLAGSFFATALLDARAGNPVSTLPPPPSQPATSSPGTTGPLLPVQFEVPVSTPPLEPTAVPSAAPEPPTAEAEPPTAEPLPTTVTPVPSRTPVPTEPAVPTEAPEPTAIPEPIGIQAPTKTAEPPTAMPVPPTPAPLPPTPAPLPPTATPVPPTATLVPPTAAPTAPPPPSPVPTPAPRIDNLRVQATSSQEIEVTVDYCHGQGRGPEVALAALASMNGQENGWFEPRSVNLNNECGTATTRVLFRHDDALTTVATNQIQVELRTRTQVILRRTFDYAMT